jgi:hypothetical protein
MGSPYRLSQVVHCSTTRGLDERSLQDFRLPLRKLRLVSRFPLARKSMCIEKFENSTVLQRGQLLAMEKLWRFSDSGLETGPVQFYRHRQGPVPGTGRVKRRRLFRHPRTTSERRADFSNRATKEILESLGVALKLRQKRKSHTLPNAYDDLSIRYKRSWKEHRGTQRKNADRIDRRIHGTPFWG